MYSKEQRRIAIETFIRFDHSYADTIAELGYPDRHSQTEFPTPIRGILYPYEGAARSSPEASQRP